MDLTRIPARISIFALTLVAALLSMNLSPSLVNVIALNSVVLLVATAELVVARTQFHRGQDFLSQRFIVVTLGAALATASITSMPYAATALLAGVLFVHVFNAATAAARRVMVELTLRGVRTF